MDNIHDTVVEGNVHEERRNRADSPGRENPGEAREQLYSEVQVHSPAGGDRGSPDYMEIRDGDRHRCSSPSSSDDDEVKAEEVAEQKAAAVEPEPVVEVRVEQVNGEAHSGSWRSSSSSASSASPGDPCDDQSVQPRIQDEDNAEDGMLMAYTHPNTDAKLDESVDYSLTTLESVTLDESRAAPAEPSQPEVSLFVKVRNRYRSAEGSIGECLLG